MKTLDEIGVEHGTDKSSLNHHYLSLYEMMFESIRDDFIRILEVGVQFGNSLRAWREYFPRAEIIGIDSIDNNVKTDGIRIIIADAYTIECLDKLTGQFDIIIDDGSHQPHDQKWFVKFYCEWLTDHGILIVEDVLSPETIPALADCMPSGFRYMALDMTQGDSQVDSRLFIARRKNAVPTKHLKSVTFDY